MRVLVLGATALARQIADVVGDDCCGVAGDPSAWIPCEFAVAAGYRHIVPAAVLAHLPIVNLHTGYLPWNRGSYPNVWPLLDGTPAGVTLHWMDTGVDTGDIIAQREVSVEPCDTAWTLYQRLQTAAVALFAESWPAVRAGTAPRRRQTGPGTHHRMRELETVTLRLDATQPVAQTLAVLRARSFPGYPGVILDQDGKRWEVTVACRPLP